MMMMLLMIVVVDGRTLRTAGAGGQLERLLLLQLLFAALTVRLELTHQRLQRPGDAKSPAGADQLVAVDVRRSGRVVHSGGRRGRRRRRRVTGVLLAMVMSMMSRRGGRIVCGRSGGFGGGNWCRILGQAVGHCVVGVPLIRGKTRDANSGL